MHDSFDALEEDGDNGDDNVMLGCQRRDPVHLVKSNVLWFSFYETVILN